MSFCPHPPAARRIAFILYLVPRDWDAAADGGSLDLFDTTPDGRSPRDVVRRLAPVWNSLAFFDVSHVSHHQVRARGRRRGNGGSSGGGACECVWMSE